MPVQHVHSREEFQKAIADTKFNATIVDFTATWCGPCQAMAPIFESLSSVYSTVKFIKVDVDELEEIAAEADVGAMPTFKLYKNCKFEADVIGADKDGVESLVKKFA